jgi:trk system potassium uptake protein TrkH
MARHFGRHVSRILNPRSVIHVPIGDSTLENAVVSSCMAFFGLYFTIFAAGTFVASLFEPDLITAISGAATALGNVGPGFAKLGASGNFAGQAAAAKWAYSFLMLCGRLELYTVLALFSRTFWRDGIIMKNGG